MGIYILLFEIFLLFKIMQKTIEVKHYCLSGRDFPMLSWIFFGKPVDGEKIEKREAAIYKWLANLFFVYLVFAILFFEKSDLIFRVDELLKASLAMFSFAFLRALPHIRVIYKSIENMNRR